MTKAPAGTQTAPPKTVPALQTTGSRHLCTSDCSLLMQLPWRHWGVSYLVCNVVYTKCHLCLAELPIWLVLILQHCSTYQHVYLERIFVAMTESMTVVMLVWRARLCVLDVPHGEPWRTLSRTGNMAVCQSLATTTQSSPGLKGKAVSASMAALLKSTKRF